jgi:hypothetical protein
MYTLHVPAGTYAETSLVRLAWLVLTHRLEHYLKGEGFRD